MKKRLIISSVISIFLVSVLLLGSTYSIFTSQEIDETANVYKTGNLNVTYSIKNVDNKNSVQITDPTPMTVEEADAVIPYRVTVTNKGNVPYEFDVILLDTTSSEENTIDYQYIMTKVGYLEPVALSNCTNNIIKENVIVPAGKSVDIDIRIWLSDNLSNSEIGKSFYAKLKIDGLAVYNDDEDIDNSKLSLRYMKTSSTNDFRNDAYRTYITTASFVDYIDTTNVAINTETNEKIMWDMSTAQDESVIAWLEDNGAVDESGNKLYDLYIGSDEKIYAKSLAKFFNSMSGLLNISINSLDTSLTNDMVSMFEKCSSIETLDLSDFDTSNVTVMNTPGYYASGGMFRNCSSLKYLDVSSFDTSKVKLFGNMFSGCIVLSELNLSGFDISSANDISNMFKNCESLTSLDVSNFDTSSVTNMSSMFYNCTGLSSLDLSNFDTSSVTNMSSMFYNCTGLSSLDLSNFDTSSVISMSAMFYNCTGLSSLDLSNFDTSSVTSMSSMFYNCTGLSSLDLNNFDTSSVTNMSSMFNSCKSLTNLDLSNFDTSNVTSMAHMFSNMASIEYLEISNFDTSNVTNMEGLFYNSSTSLNTSFTIMNSNVNVHSMFFTVNLGTLNKIEIYYVGDNPETIDINESTESIVNSLVNGTTIVNAGCIGNYCSV